MPKKKYPPTKKNNNKKKINNKKAQEKEILEKEDNNETNIEKEEYKENEQLEKKNKISTSKEVYKEDKDIQINTEKKLPNKDDTNLYEDHNIIENGEKGVIINNIISKEEYSNYINEYYQYSDINIFLKDSDSENEKKEKKKKEKIISKINEKTTREANLSMEDALDETIEEDNKIKNITNISKNKIPNKPNEENSIHNIE